MSDKVELTELDEAAYGNQAAEFELHSMRLQIAELQADVSRKQTLLDDAKNVMERQIARRKELKAQVLALQSWQVVAETALNDLLPGLILDRRYADLDDDVEALDCRVKTVTDALNARPQPLAGEPT